MACDVSSMAAVDPGPDLISCFFGCWRHRQLKPAILGAGFAHRSLRSLAAPALSLICGNASVSLVDNRLQDATAQEPQQAHMCAAVLVSLDSVPVGIWQLGMIMNVQVCGHSMLLYCPQIPRSTAVFMQQHLKYTFNLVLDVFPFFKYTL